jgi:hypothetical protein
MYVILMTILLGVITFGISNKTNRWKVLTLEQGLTQKCAA